LVGRAKVPSAGKMSVGRSQEERPQRCRNRAFGIAHLLWAIAAPSRVWQQWHGRHVDKVPTIAQDATNRSNPGKVVLGAAQLFWWRSRPASSSSHCIGKQRGLLACYADWHLFRRCHYQHRQCPRDRRRHPVARRQQEPPQPLVRNGSEYARYAKGERIGLETRRCQKQRLEDNHSCAVYPL
jgi:hypothetical protein